MTTLDLQSLGFTDTELRDRVVERIADQAMLKQGVTFDGDECFDESIFAQQLDALVKQRIEDTISAIAEKHVLPNVAACVENLTLQATNVWGEARGEKVTFIEYLTQRAEAYLAEKVDYSGNTKTEARSGYSWKASQTRVSHLVHAHLQYSIKRAMEDALKTANSAIVEGIEGAVKIKLAEVAKALKVSVKTS